MTKGLGLFSGGLDSVLAACVLREQGVEVTGVCFESPFFSAKNARSAAEQIGIPLWVRDITAPHLEMMQKPKHGFGSNMNPCIDCHILMVKTAAGIMREQGFDFVFTGEVLNERPMSQNRQALGMVEKESGCSGYLLRPLSAKLLDETIPENEGKVDRERLCDLHGRSRKPQMALANKYGITRYAQPAGGCLLTDPGFSTRLRDLMEHEGLGEVARIHMLKVGRHFRLPSGKKVIVGRKESENRELLGLALQGDAVLRSKGIPGPIVLLGKGFDEDDLREASRFCARYSDAKSGEAVSIEYRCKDTVSTLTIACPAPEEIGNTATKV
ncbi:MAG: tRNA 4-thiouridine(8) synthase ThiI [Candidatus Aureabacteria bacterium]|nr:tRNA 4-thiouridine(8) synthase ThiI [Candidatus Auribacterota bacterium]